MAVLNFDRAVSPPLSEVIGSVHLKTWTNFKIRSPCLDLNIEMTEKNQAKGCCCVWTSVTSLPGKGHERSDACGGQTVAVTQALLSVSINLKLPCFA